MGNVRHAVYSETSAELFWDRATDNGLVQGYEIIRNGELLGLFDSLSLFQGDLNPAVIYTYEVTAVDTDGNLSATQTVRLSTGGLDVSGENNPLQGSGTGSAPNFPANLRHQVYSQTSAEIFWDRATDDGFIQGYEIIRNDESLGVRDSLSLFESGLDSATSYTYTVTAIDTDGDRSVPATITFSTVGNSAGTNENGGSGPNFSANLRHDVYSQTSAEIFWDRATDDGLVQGYEVVRNGESLGIRDSLSLFESGLDPQVIYTYEVTAIDTEGNRSATATLILSTGGLDVGSVSNPTSSSGSLPSAPGNLRHRVHSSSAAEIFWDRASDDGFVQGYEIVRNSESLGVRDVLGIFEGSLDPAVTYTYVVTSVDNEGNRSAPASITVTTGSIEAIGSAAGALR